jgi:hypothetical protein
MTDEQIIVLVFGILIIVIVFIIIIYYGGKRSRRNIRHYHVASDGTKHYVGPPTKEIISEL